MQTFISVITVLYVLSLFPSPFSGKDGYLDLGSVIQQMQNLHHASISEQVDFGAALRGSVLSLKALAGMNSIVINKTNKNNASQEGFLLIVLVKSPYLLLNSNYHPSISLKFKGSPILEDKLYTSLDFPPETPPPIAPFC